MIFTFFGAEDNFINSNKKNNTSLKLDQDLEGMEELREINIKMPTKKLN